MSSHVTKTSKSYVYRSTGGQAADISIEYGTDVGAFTRLEDKIRLLHEDLESERELRQRIEREKADLSVQVIQMSERLEEAEAGTDSQIENNKKRDMELQKLRKLLEDVHMESEETAHMLRKKHQESLQDLQDQLELAMKSRAKIEKEKGKLQQEIYELLNQIELSNKDKLQAMKNAEKLEITVHEFSIKIEELNRTIIDLTTHKSRLSQENLELIKEVQELKISIENVTFTKSQLATQFEDCRRRLEDEERRRSTLENTLHTIEVELESVRVQLEEEAEARLDLERQLSKANSDAANWKSKYDAEASARIEEIEELRRKFHARISELEEQIESLMAKCSGLEKQKSRLQSEVEVLIIDLEKANGTARELQKRVDHLERLNGDLKSKLDELGSLYEAAQRDLRQKTADIMRLSHELDKTRGEKDQLARENKKLSDDLHDAKNTLAELNRRYHEMELEVRRLENEREELSAAYREAEAARKAEEQRAQRLAAELAQLRHDYEKRIAEKDEEIECIKKQMSIEIEQLNARLAEAEVKLKTEVQRIKKKMQIQITELEMSLDVANKNNIELQKTIKKQSLQLTEISNHYDEVQRQLQVTLDQYGIAQKRIQALTGELEEMRSALDAALRAKRNAEQMYEDAHSRVNELTTINVNLSSSKAKLEQEYGALQGDYDELSKELRMADDRFQKATGELKHTVDILHDEQERIVKIESIKKSLEVEVRNLTIRLEEVEANALIGGKRIISKLEARVRDIELELDEEKRRHAETVKILRKKERQVKEILIAAEEDRKTACLAQEQVDKLTEKVKMFKRQMTEQEGMSQQSITRVRRFQRELEAAEERADTAEGNLSMIRAKHRTFVTAIPGGSSQTFVVEEHRTTHESY
jgi:chromosome segregation ATPase